MHPHTPVSLDASHAVALLGSTGLGALVADRLVAALIAFLFSILAMAVAEIARPWFARWARRFAPPPEPQGAPELAARPTVAPPPPPAP